MNQSKLLPTLTILLTTTACAMSSGTRAPVVVDSLRDRLDAYERYAVDEEAMDEAEEFDGDNPLQLKSGHEVKDARELLPRVAPESTTASHIKQLEHHEAAATGWLTAGIATAAVGGFTASMAMAAQTVRQNEYDLAEVLGRNPKSFSKTPYFVTALVSAGVGLVAAIGGYVGSNIHKGYAEEARQSAFQSYNGDLLRFLDLCSETGQVVPCHSQLSQSKR